MIKNRYVPTRAIVALLGLLMAQGAVSAEGDQLPLNDPVYGQWVVEGDTIGEGVPEYLATTKSKDSNMLLWIAFAPDGDCMPSIVLKSIGPQRFEGEPEKIKDKAVFAFSAGKSMEYMAYPANQYIYEFLVNGDEFDSLATTFKDEKGFKLSVISDGKAIIDELEFGLDNASTAIEDARNRCKPLQ